MSSQARCSPADQSPEGGCNKERKNQVGVCAEPTIRLTFTCWSRVP